MFRIILKSRHELIKLFRNSVLRWGPAERDCLWIEIPIERADKTIHSEILIALKREMKQITLSMPHIQSILSQHDPLYQQWNQWNFPLCVLAENQESVDAFFRDGRVLETVMNNADSIIALHVTDQRLYSKYDYVFKGQFRLDARTESRWPKLIKDILHMADVLSKMKVSQKT